MPHTLISGKRADWYHFHKIDESDLAFLHNNFKFHPLDYEDIRSDTSISKLDVYKHYIFCVFHIPRLNPDTGRVYGEVLYMFVSQDHLVTICERPIPALERSQAEMEKRQKKNKDILKRGTGFLMYRLLLEAFQDGMPIVSELENDVTHFEDEIHQGQGRRVTIELGRARRNALFVRHVVGPQRRMMATLGSLDRYFLPAELEDYVDDLRDQLDTMWLTTENMKLIIDGIFDVNEALMTHKTNRVITLLTILSASLSGPMLVAGFYGMNATWLPNVGDARFVSWVYFASFFFILIVVAWAVRRKPAE